MLGLSWYHFALAALALLALVLSGRTPRGWIWVAGISASYVLSIIYVRLERPDEIWTPPPSAVTFLCDAMLAFFVHALHRERWEWWGLFVPFSTSAMVSFIQTLGGLAGVPPPLPVDAYSSILEAITAAALLIIGGIGAVDWAHGLDLARPDGRPAAAAAFAARAPTRASKARWHWPAAPWTRGGGG